ncbi:hypothetical protein Goshw_018708 [Gossypium schwendimanii]|uniref:Uncharacterized protein n=1 Tax=Gossypium schwendimanii TaxID=34291 RepID=A0A7J9N5D4_GOSSC|nr:hypothetical protein [Gossypium schwendimanii]
MVSDCQKKYMFYAIKKDDVLDNATMRRGSIVYSVEVNRVKENDKKPVKCFLYSGLELGSMIFNSTKAKRSHKQKGLMYVDINIAGQKMSALVDIRASDLFISEKAIDTRGRTKVLSAIQLIKDVLCGKNIDLVDWSAKEVPLKMLERQQTDMLPVELLVGLHL